MRRERSSFTVRPRVMVRMAPAALFVLVLGVYALLAPVTRDLEDKDWSHLWLGGRMIATGHAARMYDSALQLEVYREAHPRGEPPATWRVRNEILGCFNYPPPAALAYAALAWMPMSTAAMVNAYLTLALTLPLAWMLARNLAPRVPLHWPAIAIFAYPPFFFNFSLGQNAVVTMFILVGAWHLCNARKDFAAGLLLGLLICKPNWLLAIGWVPLVHQRWRVLLGICIGASSAVVATLLFLGFKPFLDYAEVFRNVSQLNELPGYVLKLKYSSLGLFRKWLGAGSIWADALGWGCSAVLAAATWNVCRGAWQPGTARFRRMMACSLMAALWVNPHLNYYDLTISAACVAAVALDWNMLGRTQRAAAVAVALFTYAATPWDRLWTWDTVFPVPSFAILALWGWFAYLSARPPVPAPPEPASRCVA